MASTLAIVLASPLPFTRLTERAITAYDVVGRPVTPASLIPTASFPVPEGAEIHSHTVAPDLTRAVYTLADAAVCIDGLGIVLWRLDFEPAACPDGATCGCECSADSAAVWIYRPDTGDGCDGCDLLMAVNLRTGAIIDQVPLETTGYGAVQFAHPDGAHLLLCISEADDRVRLCRAGLGQDGIETTMFHSDHRDLVDLSPDGQQFMTVDVERESVAFHRWKDGSVKAQFGVDAFDYEPDSAFIDCGGYLDATAAIVTIVQEIEGEAGDEEWYCHHILELDTWQFRGVIDTLSDEPDFVAPLGDGTWLTTVGEEAFHRHSG
ncbi:MAG: hypothetical protein JXA67_14285 [Micromonosporaceae bacterium]|nr:hypothetical protein [Micromonosporaceae bacterium]